MKQTKKGFTLVELLVVIAILAILATVSVVGYTSFIQKANISADESAVTQMNMLLDLEKCDTIMQATALFEANGLDLKDYKPLTKDHFFYFVNGKVILADAQGNVVYPANVDSNGQWMSLSGLVPTDSNYTVENGAVTLANGAQLVHLMDAYSNGEITGDLVINLPAGNLNLMGTATTFGEVNGNVTLIGAVDANGNPATTVSGIRSEENTFVGQFEGKPKSYGYSIFGSVPSGSSLTVENIKITDVVINTPGTSAGHSGIIAGSVYGTVSISNVQIDNCVVVGNDKGASLIGYLVGTATINNVTVTNTEVTGWWYTAKAIGCVSKKSNAVATFTNCNFDGVTVSARAGDDVYMSAYDFVSVEKYEAEDGTYGTYGVDSPSETYCIATNAWYWRGTAESVEHNGETYQFSPFFSTSYPQN